MYRNEPPSCPLLFDQALPLLADALGWPDGVLAACQALGEKHPAWFVYYSDASTELPPGYRAALRVPTTRDHRAVCGEDPQTLVGRVFAEEERLMTFHQWWGEPSTR